MLKAFADDKINVNKNLKFVLGRVENIVGKGENAGYQHFLLFPQCFQKASFSGSLKVYGKKLNLNTLTLYHTIQTFNDPPRKTRFENIVGKGENAGYQHFLLFPQSFQPNHRWKSLF